MTTANPADTFTAMLHAIDAKDWRGVRQAFADDVDVDYSSLFGVPAARVSADALVGGWQAFAGSFTATQHLTGPFLESRTDAGARARTHVRAYHWMTGAAGGDCWIVAGHYDVQLRLVGESWRIAGITLTVFAQEGNLTIPALARERAAS